MAGFIPEITTTVKVNVKTEDIDKCLQQFEGSEIANECFNELLTDLQDKKAKLEQLKDDVGEAVAENLASNQSQIISMKHYWTGMMANSVDVTKDGDGVYLVGNTAMSVDGFPYPLAIETGRREIYPINAKMLRWWDRSGKIVFAKRSRAVEADPFVQHSINMTEESVAEIVAEFEKTVFSD